MVRVTADERNDACNRIHWKVLNRFSVVYLPIISFRMHKRVIVIEIKLDISIQMTAEHGT